MTKDELYPIIDEVLHQRSHQYTNAGSFWIDQSLGDVQLCIHELTEALCDAIVSHQRSFPDRWEARRER